MSTNFKRFISLLLYTTFVIIICFLGERHLLHLKQLGRSTFNFYPYLIGSAIFPIIIGIIIAFPKFLIEFRKKGEWKVDWVKLVAIGVPVLYIAIFPFGWVFLSYTGGSNFPFFNVMYPLHLTMYLPIELSGVVLGFLLLITPYKNQKDDDENTIS